MKTIRSAMLFFQVLPFTDMKKRDGFWCLTHLKLPRRFCMLFFDVLPFTDDASVVNGKIQRKACKNDAAVFGVSRP